MSEHGPEEHCYWYERYLELEANFAWTLQGVATAMESAESSSAAALQAELDRTKRDLAKLQGSRLGRTQAALWQGRRAAARRVKPLLRRLGRG